MNRREGDEHMRILYELSWLWEMLGIALAAAAVCVTCAALICKATKKRPNKKCWQSQGRQHLPVQFWQSF